MIAWGADEAEDVQLTVQIGNAKAEHPFRYRVSALTGEGIEALLDQAEQMISEASDVIALTIPPSEGRAIAWLHQHGEVLEERTDTDTGSVIGRFRLSPSFAGRFRSMFPALAGQLPVIEEED